MHENLYYGVLISWRWVWWVHKVCKSLKRQTLEELKSDQQQGDQAFVTLVNKDLYDAVYKINKY